MLDAPTLLVFLGGLGAGEAERLVAGARLVATLDSVEQALATGAFAGAVLVTDDLSVGRSLHSADVAPLLAPGSSPHLELSLDVPGEAFHFGRRLANVIEERNLRSVVYMGGGSLPLATPEDFRAITDALAGGGAVTNNLYSSDLVAFPVVPQVLPVVEGVSRDNALARALFEAGVPVEALPRTLATQMDIDSPADLLVLALTGFGGPRLREYLAALALDTSRLQPVLPLFTDTRAQILVAGRVGSHAWQYLERETACRVRLFAEERGMEAEGRAESGEARSVLGFLLEAVGLERFFVALAEMGDAAFLDTRVLLAHRRIAASREDRFLSDLGRWGDITDPFLRDFTRAALAAPLPVLLGGHSLMSGGLMALNEHAWREKERGG